MSDRIKAKQGLVDRRDAFDRTRLAAEDSYERFLSSLSKHDFEQALASVLEALNRLEAAASHAVGYREDFPELIASLIADAAQSYYPCLVEAFGELRRLGRNLGGVPEPQPTFLERTQQELSNSLPDSSLDLATLTRMAGLPVRGFPAGARILSSLACDPVAEDCVYLQRDWGIDESQCVRASSVRAQLFRLARCSLASLSPEDWASLEGAERESWKGSDADWAPRSDALAGRRARLTYLREAIADTLARVIDSDGDAQRRGNAATGLLALAMLSRGDALHAFARGGGRIQRILDPRTNLPSFVADTAELLGPQELMGAEALRLQEEVCERLASSSGVLLSPGPAASASPPVQKDGLGGVDGNGSQRAGFSGYRSSRVWGLALAVVLLLVVIQIHSVLSDPIHFALALLSASAFPAGALVLQIWSMTGDHSIPVPAWIAERFKWLTDGKYLLSLLLLVEAFVLPFGLFLALNLTQRELKWRSTESYIRESEMFWAFTNPTLGREAFGKLFGVEISPELTAQENAYLDSPDGAAVEAHVRRLVFRRLYLALLICSFGPRALTFWSLALQRSPALVSVSRLGFWFCAGIIGALGVQYVVSV